MALAPPVDEQLATRSSVRNQWWRHHRGGQHHPRRTLWSGWSCGWTAQPMPSPVFGGEGEVISLITRASAEELGIAPRRRVSASVKATALHVLAG